MQCSLPLCPPQGEYDVSQRDPEVVSGYLLSELQQGRLVGPLNSRTDHIHTNLFGVIPKRNQPDKWRLITDLSSPRGSSINDGIDPALCSVHYSGLDEAVAMITRLGRGCLLAKTDLKSAYRIVPVHPDDRPLLGMNWDESLYLDAALPFGLRSAPKIFSAVADSLLWILAQRGLSEAIHYLDDFLIAGQPGSAECARNLAIALETFRILGVPIALEKNEGPASSISYLGILIDTLKGELRIPAEKLARILQELDNWLGKKACSKRELLSLIGLLHHAASVVVAGRPFLHHLISLSKIPKHLHYMVRLNNTVHLDIKWWHTFIHLERSGVPALLLPAGYLNVQRIRHLGLWCLLESKMAPAQMAGSSALFQYCFHGAAPYPSGRHSLGATVAILQGSLSL